MATKLPIYQTYIVRFWKELTTSADDEAVWRFTLEDPKTGQRLGFASAEAFLEGMRAALDNAQALQSDNE